MENIDVLRIIVTGGFIITGAVLAKVALYFFVRHVGGSKVEIRRGVVRDDDDED